MRLRGDIRGRERWARGRDTRQKYVEKPFDSSTRRVTYPESYITRYTTYTKIKARNVVAQLQPPRFDQASRPEKGVSYNVLNIEMWWYDSVLKIPGVA